MEETPGGRMVVVERDIMDGEVKKRHVIKRITDALSVFSDFGAVRICLLRYCDRMNT